MYRRLAVWASSGPARGSAGPHAGKAPADRGENVVQGFADLFREDKRRHLRAHERLDWKAWNLFLALLPPAGLYLTMSYARKDMDEIVRSGGESFRTTRASKKETGVARPKHQRLGWEGRGGNRGQVGLHRQEGEGPGREAGAQRRGGQGAAGAVGPAARGSEEEI